MKVVLNKRLLFALGCGLAGYGLQRKIYRDHLLRTADEKKEKTTGKKIEYDIFNKKIKNVKPEDQAKLVGNNKTREEHLKELKDPENIFDVLIIGGGCNGAGVLLDASTRGLQCALIDRGDFASETSCRSTKLIHGGIRYLQDVFKFPPNEPYEKWKLVVEGLNERNFMLNSAAYMNRKVEMIIPCSNLFYVVYYFMGVCLYHFLSYVKWCFSDYSYRLPVPRIIGKAQMKTLLPHLNIEGYGIRFSEGQMNDARLVLQNILTSSIDNYVPGMKGAVVGNYVEFEDFLKDDKGKIIGAKLYDRLEKSHFEVKAKSVVNCAGAFADNIRLQDNPAVPKRILGSRGVHIIIPSKYTESGLGILIPKTVDGRIMFVLPFQGQAIAGTTDHPCEITSGPEAPESDINEIVSTLQNYFKGDIKKEISAAWCGIRPLVISNSQSQSKYKKYFAKITGLFCKKKEVSSKSLTRSHEVEVSESGLISLLGGKWTAYRRMGEDTVDAILQRFPEIAPAHSTSISRDIRLFGGYTNKTFDGTETSISDFIDFYSRFIHETFKLEWDSCHHMLQCYGTRAVKVAKLGDKEKMNEKIHPKLPCIKAQVIYAIRNEFAVKVKDVVFRRLGVGLINQSLALEIIPEVAKIMASELGWSSTQMNSEIEEATSSIKSLA